MSDLRERLTEEQTLRARIRELELQLADERDRVRRRDATIVMLSTPNDARAAVALERIARALEERQYGITTEAAREIAAELAPRGEWP